MGTATTALGLGQRGFETETALFADRQAREASGFSSALQSELDFLLNRIVRGERLEDVEMARVRQLADAESGFERQKELIQLQTDEAIRQTLATRKPTTDGTGEELDIEADFDLFGANV